MEKKQLRTVKKSSQTGRLNRAEVRSAVITVRDSSTGRYNTRAASKGSRNPASDAGKHKHSDGGSRADVGCTK